MTVSHWLMVNVVMKGENAAVFALGSGLVGILVLTPFRSVLKKLWRAIDSLDPSTDTGVTKELDDLKQRIAPRHTPDPDTIADQTRRPRR